MSIHTLRLQNYIQLDSIRISQDSLDMLLTQLDKTFLYRLLRTKNKPFSIYRYQR